MKGKAASHSSLVIPHSSSKKKRGDARVRSSLFFFDAGGRQGLATVAGVAEVSVVGAAVAAVACQVASVVAYVARVARDVAAVGADVGLRSAFALVAVQVAVVGAAVTHVASHVAAVVAYVARVVADVPSILAGVALRSGCALRRRRQARDKQERRQRDDFRQSLSKHFRFPLLKDFGSAARRRRRRSREQTLVEFAEVPEERHTCPASGRWKTLFASRRRGGATRFGHQRLLRRTRLTPGRTFLPDQSDRFLSLHFCDTLRANEG